MANLVRLVGVVLVSVLQVRPAGTVGSLFQDKPDHSMRYCACPDTTFEVCIETGITSVWVLLFENGRWK